MLLDRFSTSLPAAELEDDDRRPIVVLVAATLLLTVFFYWGRPGFYRSSGIGALVTPSLPAALVDWSDALPYVWWGLTSLVLRVGVPLLVIMVILRESPRSWGFRIEGIARHLPAYALMYVAMLPVLLWVSSFDSFSTYYPFYDRAVEGGIGFWMYEIGYGLQFVGVEAFFRGFLLFGLYPRFGPSAIAVMVVPYTMIHFAKPAPEAFAAIGAGFILGFMALRSRSFVPGIFLHVGVAITMDLLVILRL